ncbi:IclR family transcriptional regulator [Varunaivibrio sulfuroxidans]|uniref:IclR family transcriptional regulator n=1 Tax=Varunaivibrio sulfuroxidans TaxID=1773489 RepID=A0A4V2UNR8_9PROT|nr:IclR family transcriptional regulator [Varunaivibrio sulfuroxidans]TCS63091.1 IclR family transcriptional regulator [Varunaivibrio sulfuroxidans]WES31837.1 IclR family transcriptional regulator [Varunaivibrio sulfuroxidans]
MKCAVRFGAVGAEIREYWGGMVLNGKVSRAASSSTGSPKGAVLRTKTSGVGAVRASVKVATKKGGTIQSVARAFKILDILAQGDGPVALTAISSGAGLNISTCHHLLNTLSQLGCVFQDPRTREYALGNKLFELSNARIRQIDLGSLAMPFLRDLNNRTGEAVHLAVIQGVELMTLAKLDTLHAVKVDSGYVGKSKAAHATATGKAILAYLGDADFKRIILAEKLERFTEHTLCSRKALLQNLKEVRSLGYAEDREEFQPGVHCVGAPIRNNAGEVVASVSCSVPTMRATADFFDQVRGLVIETAAKISQELGYLTPG